MGVEGHPSQDGASLYKGVAAGITVSLVLTAVAYTIMTTGASSRVSQLRGNQEMSDTNLAAPKQQVREETDDAPLPPVEDFRSVTTQELDAPEPEAPAPSSAPTQDAGFEDNEPPRKQDSLQAQEWDGEPCIQGATAMSLKAFAGNEKDIDNHQLQLLRAVRDGGAVANDESVFMDVGANIGEFTSLIAKVWPQRHYFLFEMMPQLQSAIRGTMERAKILGDSYTVVQAAAGDEPGKKVPILGNSGMGSTWTGASLLERDQIGQRKFGEKLGEATTVSLSDWAGSSEGMGREANVPFMKIDTEGMDGKVLRGMTTPENMLLSKQVRSVFFELNKMSMKTDVPPEQQFRLLEEQGFDTYLFTTRSLVRISGECFRSADYLPQNFYTRNALALPKGEKFSCCVLTKYDGKDRGCGC